MLAGMKLATYIAMATLILAYGVIPLAVALGAEIVEWAWWTFIVPSIGHLVAIAFVELLALFLGVGSILHIGGLAPGVATAALEAAALTSFTTVLPLHVLHMIGSAIILMLSFCSILYLLSDFINPTTTAATASAARWRLPDSLCLRWKPVHLRGFVGHSRI